MLTGDLNTASVEWTVQWKVTEPSQFLFRFPLEEHDRLVRRGPADDRGPHRHESAGGRLLLRRSDRVQAERHRLGRPAKTSRGFSTPTPAASP